MNRSRRVAAAARVEPSAPVDLHKATKAVIESVLWTIFGPIELIEHNGHYIAVEADT